MSNLIMVGYHSFCCLLPGFGLFVFFSVSPESVCTLGVLVLFGFCGFVFFSS